MRTLLCVLAALACALPPSFGANAPKASVKHVILFSFDGMHESDLRMYATQYAPSSSPLAKLYKSGVVYNNTFIRGVTDSVPGLQALLTGGSTKSHGMFYDDSYDRSLFPPGTTCDENGVVDTTKTPPGSQVNYEETIDINLNELSGGGNPGYGPSSINVAALPVDRHCKPVYPGSHVRVNNIFEVAKSEGLITAFSDKHAGAGQMLYGPSGKGLDDYYGPEINSLVPGGNGSVWTDHQNDTMTYDMLHTAALLNWIKGKTWDGKKSLGGVPAIFGANYQTLSVGQKIAPSLGEAYNADGTFGYYTLRAMQFLDEQVGNITAALDAAGLTEETALVITAKHGQSPINHTLCNLIKASDLQTTIDNAVGAGVVATITADDVALIWLNYANQSRVNDVAQALLANAKALAINNLYYDRGLIFAGFNDAYSDDRVPDIIIKVVPGTIYVSNGAYNGQTKCAEHGGLNVDDQHVGLLIANPKATKAGLVTSKVQTLQVAPTILDMLGIEPTKLQAVVKEHVKVLPTP